MRFVTIFRARGKNFSFLGRNRITIYLCFNCSKWRRRPPSRFLPIFVVSRTGSFGFPHACRKWVRVSIKTIAPLKIRGRSVIFLVDHYFNFNFVVYCPFLVPVSFKIYSSNLRLFEKKFFAFLPPPALSHGDARRAARINTMHFKEDRTEREASSLLLRNGYRIVSPAGYFRAAALV